MKITKLETSAKDTLYSFVIVSLLRNFQNIKQRNNNLIPIKIVCKEYNGDF